MTAFDNHKNNFSMENNFYEIISKIQDKLNGVSIQKRKTYLVLFAAFFIVVFAIRVLLAAGVFKTSPTAATATEQTQNGVFDEAASSEKDKIKVLEYDMNPSADKADLDQLKNMANQNENHAEKK